MEAAFGRENFCKKALGTEQAKFCWKNRKEDIIWMGHRRASAKIKQDETTLFGRNKGLSDCH